MILPHIAAFISRFKLEVTVASLVTAFLAGVGLLANAVTSPKVLAVAIMIGEWEAAFTKQTLVYLGISTLFSLGTWWLQKKVNERREAASKKNATDLQTIVDFEKADKKRLAEDQVELKGRVSDTENILREFKEKIALMDQTVRPLFEATKLELIKSLTHPSPEFEIPDALLQEIVPPGATLKPELAALLKARETSSHPEVTPKEKLAAALLPKIIILANEEAKTASLSTSTQAVSIPAQPAAKVEEEAKKEAK